VVQVVENLPSKHEVLTLNPNTTKKKKKKKERKKNQAGGMAQVVVINLYKLS
jgi:hypothetical protein